MTAHDHRAFVEGCYRCELSRDEGGDGSPQLDLDAIEACVSAGGTPSVTDSEALVALVRRLQQENERYEITLARALSSDLEGEEGADWHTYWRVARDEAARQKMGVEVQLQENAALRGRVEELTEALRKQVEYSKIEYGGCGGLAWTVEKWGRLTHKHGCPHRTDPFCQTHPEGCP
jgi:hypothetical protein